LKRLSYETMNKLLCLLLVLLLLPLSAGADTVIVTSESAFLAALSPGYYAENFATASPGNATSLSFTGNGFAFTATADAAGTNNGVFANPFGLPSNIQTFASGDDLVFTFTGTPVTAVGGYFYDGDNVGNFGSGLITLSFRDGTLYSFAPNSYTDFRGAISDTPIQSITVTGASQYATCAFLISGTAAAAPEPASGALTLLAIPLLALTRKRRP
jgi:hypothetical protein